MSDNEQTYFLTEESPFRFQLPSSLLVAQAESGAAGSTSLRPDAGKSEAEEQAKIAEAMANPFSDLWVMFTQNATTWCYRCRF
jgi:hypothetical protein